MPRIRWRISTTLPLGAKGGPAIPKYRDAGYYIFLALLFLLVVSLILALEGNLWMSAAFATALGVSIAAIWWFKYRM